MDNELTEELEAARNEFYKGLARDEVKRELNPPLFGDSRANIRSARALGKLASAIARRDMTLSEAIETARLSPELGLIGGEVEWVVERLTEDATASQ